MSSSSRKTSSWRRVDVIEEEAKMSTEDAEMAQNLASGTQLKHLNELRMRDLLHNFNTHQNPSSRVKKTLI